MSRDRSSVRRRARGAPLALVAVLTLLAGLVSGPMSPPAAEAQAGSLVEVRNFGSNPGNLRMFKYLPADLPANAPVVVPLHGCFQNASLYAHGSGWVQQAETFGFALVVPEQRQANNFMSCFNWYEPGDTDRGSGEALSIKQMVDNIAADHSIDTSRVFVSGLSGGGAMTSQMLAAYPDVFAGGSVVAGVPAQCANAYFETFQCTQATKFHTPQQWGDLVRGVNPSYDGPWPKMAAWGGTADWAVSDKNLTEIMNQWTNVHGTDQSPDEQETVKGHTRTTYNDASGDPVVETWLLQGQPHGQPLDPGPWPEQCGTAGSAGMVDMDICGSFHMVEFFGLDDAS